ncbi:hypothetical protein [Streptomyces griseorubiginosus]|uniref:hypothetical protein n=1 Tax=Streptomyces griseorubiginosus TaxID=67304 RepID=UPI00076D2101|nr:hypothetical protein [Streptomyces griseorubiginosus]KUM68473.1 hypothetical protein AQI84_38615 [Streptomyces griseorubiginosus]
MNRKLAATVGLVVPAVMALGMSADTSYRFLGAVLSITAPAERGILCGTAEAAVIALALYAWAAGARSAAWLAYAVVLVQAVPAFEVSGGAGGAVRTALGPVLLAVLLHLLLGLELKLSGAYRSGLVAAVLREARERLTAYLGIGRRGADSAAIARSRAADRAVVLADRVAATKAGTRRYARRTAALADAVDRARHGLDASGAQAAEAAIVSRVVRRKSAGDLAVIGERHDWSEVYRDVPAPDRHADRDAPALNPPDHRAAVVPVPGRSTADMIRDLIAEGVTKPPEISRRLLADGVSVEPGYVRRIVRQANGTP